MRVALLPPRGASLSTSTGSSAGPRSGTSPAAAALAAALAIAGTVLLAAAAAAGGRPDFGDASRVDSGVVQLAQEEGRGVCEIETGGTCVIFDCNAWRNDTKCSFGMCLCTKGTCTGTDGVCRAPDEAELFIPSRYSPAWFRQQLHGVIFSLLPGVGIILRSDVLAVVSALIWQAFCGAAKPPPTAWTQTMTWDAARTACGYSWPTAVAISILKYALYHMSQPIMFFIGFYAYSAYFGWVQYGLAWVVTLREMYYFIVLHLALSVSPAFLMIQPFTETDRSVILMYIAIPQFLCTDVFLEFVDGKCDPKCGFFLLGLFADFCAACAFIAGIAGGAMFPFLAVGYFLSSLLFPLTIYIAIFGIFGGES